MLRVGIVGFSGQKFNEKDAKDKIKKAFDMIAILSDADEVSIVSGLTDLGIPGLAYAEAAKRGWKTVGIACSKASDYDCFDVDEEIIVGDNWGDESEEFLKSIDAILRFGGGKQSMAEVKQAKEDGLLTLEFNVDQ